MPLSSGNPGRYAGSSRTGMRTRIQPTSSEDSGLGPPVRSRVRPWLVAITLVFGLNILFLLALLLAAAVPAEHLRERVVEAFDSGALSERDRLPFDTRIGWHQYNDCLILQMVANEGAAVPKALGPTVYYPGNFRHLCLTVSGLVRGELSPAAMDRFRYTRYWHGHNAVTGLALAVWQFATVRNIFRAAAYLSLLLLALVAWQSGPGLRMFGFTVALFGLLFWGLPYYAQSPSHGPGDTTVTLGLAALVAVLGRNTGVDRYVVLSSAFGAVVTYMEFLTGLLPTAAALLLPLGYLAAGPTSAERSGIAERWRFALAGLIGFGLGVTLTVAIKQLLAFGLFGGEVVDAFNNNLQYHTRQPEVGRDGRLLVAAHTTADLIRRWGRTLTYGSDAAARLLFGTAALAWIAALGLAIWRRSREALSLFLACAAGAALIYLWIVLLPNHTRHHPFMVRMMLAPLALAWIAVGLQLWSQQERIWPSRRT